MPWMQVCAGNHLESILNEIVIIPSVHQRQMTTMPLPLLLACTGTGEFFLIITLPAGKMTETLMRHQQSSIS